MTSPTFNKTVNPSLLKLFVSINAYHQKCANLDPLEARMEELRQDLATSRAAMEAAVVEFQSANNPKPKYVISREHLRAQLEGDPKVIAVLKLFSNGPRQTSDVTYQFGQSILRIFYKMVRAGLLKRVAHGVYALPESKIPVFVGTPPIINYASLRGAERTQAIQAILSTRPHTRGELYEIFNPGKRNNGTLANVLASMLRAGKIKSLPDKRLQCA